MGRTSGAAAMPSIDRQGLDRLEAHFVAPDIYRRADVAARQAKLARIVARDVVPRLVRLHAEALPDAPALGLVIQALAPDRGDADALAHILLGSDLEAAAAYVTALRGGGLPMDTLFTELLEPTARRLGEMWERDECDFVDVTLGVARLQKLLAVFNETYALPALDDRRTVLMAATPGEQHHFGLAMVERFLRAAGWQVGTEHPATAGGIVAAARQRWFAVVGLTAGSDRQFDSLRAVIAGVRASSRNPDVGIMVGGPVFTADPSLAQEVGADATAPDAPAAVLVAQKLFDLSQSRAAAAGSLP